MSISIGQLDWNRNNKDIQSSPDFLPGLCEDDHDSRLTSAHKTCRFSQLLDLPSVRHILCSISRAMLSESEVLEPCSRLTPRRARFLSRVSRSRICFSTPTSSSSTLCWIPLDVSMNLQSLEAARALPSAQIWNKSFYLNRWFNTITHVEYSGTSDIVDRYNPRSQNNRKFYLQNCLTNNFEILQDAV